MTIHWDFGLYDPKESCKVSTYCFHPELHLAQQVRCVTQRILHLQQGVTRSKSLKESAWAPSCKGRQIFVAKDSMSQKQLQPSGAPKPWSTNHPGAASLAELGIFRMRTPDSHEK